MENKDETQRQSWEKLSELGGKRERQLHKSQKGKRSTCAVEYQRKYSHKTNKEGCKQRTVVSKFQSSRYNKETVYEELARCTSSKISKQIQKTRRNKHATLRVAFRK